MTVNVIIVKGKYLSLRCAIFHTFTSDFLLDICMFRSARFLFVLFYYFLAPVLFFGIVYIILHEL